MFALSLVVIAVGFILLDRGSMTAAPLLIVIGFCVLIPIAIIIKGGREKRGAEESKELEPVR